MVIIAACSSSAHQLLDLLSDRCSFVRKACSQPDCSAPGHAIPGQPRRKDTQPVVRGWAIPRCAVPGGTPGAAAQGPDTPSWGAGTHPGLGAGLAGRAG